MTHHRLLIGLSLAAFLVCPAIARDLGQWSGELSQWYAGLMQPDNPKISCCGEADAYWADDVEISGDKVFAIVTDDRPDEQLGRHHVDIGTRIFVPAHKIKWDRGNPTGHVIIFLSLNNEVYCYVMGTGT